MCGVVDHVASARKLYIDVDKRTAPKLGPLFAGLHIAGLRPNWICYRRTMHGWHIIIQLQVGLTPGECIALQTVLGSDRRRENLNIMRAIAIRRTPIRSAFWRARWNLLYARKLR